MSTPPDDRLPDELEALDLPTDAIELLTDEAARVAGASNGPNAYDTFYEAPEQEGSDADLPAVPAELRTAPPPPEYAEYYDPPGED